METGAPLQPQINTLCINLPVSMKQKKVDALLVLIYFCSQRRVCVCQNNYFNNKNNNNNARKMPPSTKNMQNKQRSGSETLEYEYSINNYRNDVGHGMQMMGTSGQMFSTVKPVRY